MKKFILLLFGQAFLLNFVWEVTQMPLYLSTGMGEREDYLAFLAIHWKISLLDALTVLVAYLLVGAVLRRLRWSYVNDRRGWALFIFGLIGWQILVEYLAVYVYHSWAYAPAMPVIFGIGISPLVQMVALGPAALFFAQNLSRKMGSR